MGGTKSISALLLPYTSTRTPSLAVRDSSSAKTERSGELAVHVHDGPLQLLGDLVHRDDQSKCTDGQVVGYSLAKSPVLPTRRGLQPLCQPRAASGTNEGPLEILEFKLPKPGRIRKQLADDLPHLGAHCPLALDNRDLAFGIDDHHIGATDARHPHLLGNCGWPVVPDLPSDLDIDVWETPRYSAAGEDLEDQLQLRSFGHDWEDTYAWIAGESWLVKALRRSLVTESGSSAPRSRSWATGARASR